MKTFYIPNAINPKTWTCGEVVRDFMSTHSIDGLNQLREVVAALADRANDQTQIEIAMILAPELEWRA